MQAAMNTKLGAFRKLLTLLSLKINLEIESVSEMVPFLMDTHIYYRYSKEYHYIITVRTYVYMYVKIYMYTLYLTCSYSSS